MELLKLEILNDHNKVIQSVITTQEEYDKFLNEVPEILPSTNNPYEWPNCQINILDSDSDPVPININPLSHWRTTVVGSIKEDEE